MTTSPGFRAAMVIMALAAIHAVASAPIARAAPLSEAASGVVIPQLPDCSDAREENAQCIPRGPRSSTRPVEPVLPPVTLPAPPEITPEELPLFIVGTAKATLRLTGNGQDVTYESNEVVLPFMKRFAQDMAVNTDMAGNTQYLLFPTPFNTIGDDRNLDMIWTVTGQEFGCTIEGQATITFPVIPDPNPNIEGGGMLLDPTLDPTAPASGYLNVVGPDGGDFHSVTVKAFDADARYTRTCPGDPPTVTKEPFQAGFLLHILWQKNTREDGRVIFKGQQSLDEGDPLDFLNLLPPGAARKIPSEALQALRESGSGTSRRYTWEWELFPVVSLNGQN